MLYIQELSFIFSQTLMVIDIILALYGSCADSEGGPGVRPRPPT